ncbi:unnamed protein product [Cuscuta campestris]|uniref:Uncharacterized protein n=2 Tax=Cuscuta sect. Cleistogrammica TaxID=1824901 RepID=A0A484M7T0_9ASTE|nr:hypothetical protein DM860_007476 [Cuscuta australis]VFQ84900.1 unnamed protein product [Cuscuta campestris]
MASLITKEIRESATEFYEGDEKCQEKAKFLLTEMKLPNGLLPIKDMEECGYVKDTGFVWLKSKKRTDHKFEQIGRSVQYATEVTAIIEPGRIKKLTGVKAKELMLWLTITEISTDDPPTGKIHFKSTTGLSRTFPTSAFELGEENPPKKEEEKEKEEKPVVNGAGVNLEVKEV